MDMGFEDGLSRGPLAGLFKGSLPIPSIVQALEGLALSHPHLHPESGVSVKIARKETKRAQKKHSSLSMDECVAIVLYTIEEEPRDISLYFMMNAALRSKDRSQVKPWRDFIWLLVNALRKLPPVDPGDVFRGCKMAPSELNLELDVGFEFTWSAFSSTSTKLATMQQFVGKSGPRTLLTLTLTEPVGRDVRDFSLYEFQIQIQKILRANCYNVCDFQNVCTRLENSVSH